MKYSKDVSFSSLSRSTKIFKLRRLSSNQESLQHFNKLSYNSLYITHYPKMFSFNLDSPYWVYISACVACVCNSQSFVPIQIPRVHRGSVLEEFPQIVRTKKKHTYEPNNRPPELLEKIFLFNYHKNYCKLTGRARTKKITKTKTETLRKQAIKVVIFPYNIQKIIAKCRHSE